MADTEEILIDDEGVEELPVAQPSRKGRGRPSKLPVRLPVRQPTEETELYRPGYPKTYEGNKPPPSRFTQSFFQSSCSPAQRVVIVSGPSFHNATPTPPPIQAMATVTPFSHRPPGPPRSSSASSSSVTINSARLVSPSSDPASSFSTSSQFRGTSFRGSFTNSIPRVAKAISAQLVNHSQQIPTPRFPSYTPRAPFPSSSTADHRRPKAVLPFQQMPVAKKSVAKKSTGGGLSSSGSSAASYSSSVEIEACPVCDEHFARRDIAAHQATHPQCGYCGQRFASLKDIKNHIVSSHGSVTSGGDDEDEEDDGGYHVVEDEEAGVEVATPVVGDYWEEGETYEEDAVVETDEAVGDQGPQETIEDPDVVLDETVIDDDEEKAGCKEDDDDGGDFAITLTDDPISGSTISVNERPSVSSAKSSKQHPKLKKSKKSPASVKKSAETTADAPKLLRACRSRLSPKFWCSGCQSKKTCLFRDITVYECQDDNGDDNPADVTTTGVGESTDNANNKDAELDEKLQQHAQVCLEPLIIPEDVFQEEATTTNRDDAVGSLVDPGTVPVKPLMAKKLKGPKCKTMLTTSQAVPSSLIQSSIASEPPKAESSNVTTLPQSIPLKKKKKRSLTPSKSVSDTPEVVSMVKREVDEICLSDSDDDGNPLTKPDFESVVKGPKKSGISQNTALLQMIKQVVTQQQLNMTVMQNLMLKQSQARTATQRSNEKADIPTGSLSTEDLVNLSMMENESHEPTAGTSGCLIESLSAQSASDPSEISDLDKDQKTTESQPTERDALDDQSIHVKRQKPGPRSKKISMKNKLKTVPSETATTSSDVLQTPEAGEAEVGVALPTLEPSSASVETEKNPKDDSMNTITVDGVKTIGAYSGAKLQLVLPDGKIVDIEPHQHVPLKVISAATQGPPSSKTPEDQVSKEDLTNKDVAPIIEKARKSKKKGKKVRKSPVKSAGRVAESAMEDGSADAPPAETHEKSTEEIKKDGADGKIVSPTNLKSSSPRGLKSSNPKAYRARMSCRAQYGPKNWRRWCKNCRVKQACLQKSAVTAPFPVRDTVEKCQKPKKIECSPQTVLQAEEKSLLKFACKFLFKKSNWCRRCRLRKPCIRLKDNALNPTKPTKPKVKKMEKGNDELVDAIVAEASSMYDKIKSRVPKLKEKDKDVSNDDKPKDEPAVRPPKRLASKTSESVNVDPKIKSSKKDNDDQGNNIEAETKSLAKKDPTEAFVMANRGCQRPPKRLASKTSELVSLGTGIQLAKTDNDDDQPNNVGAESKPPAKKNPKEAFVMISRGCQTKPIVDKRSKVTKSTKNDAKKQGVTADNCQSKFPNEYLGWCWYCKRDIPGCNQEFAFNCKKKLPTAFASWCKNCRQRRGKCTGQPTGSNDMVCQRKHAVFKKWCWYCKSLAKKTGRYNGKTMQKCCDVRFYQNWCMPCKAKSGECFFIGGPKRCRDRGKASKFWCYQCKMNLDTCFHVDGQLPKSIKDKIAGNKKLREAGTKKSTDYVSVGHGGKSKKCSKVRVYQKWCMPCKSTAGDCIYIGGPKRCRDRGKVSKFWCYQCKMNLDTCFREIHLDGQLPKSMKDKITGNKELREAGTKNSTDNVAKHVGKSKKKKNGSLPEDESSKKRDSLAKTGISDNMTETGFFGGNETEADFVASGIFSDDDNALALAGDAFAIDRFVMKFESKPPFVNKENDAGWPWNLDCTECGKPMDDHAHFQMTPNRCQLDGSTITSGTKMVCRFSTHCRAAFADHVKRFHDPAREQTGSNGACNADLECVYCGTVLNANDMSVHMARERHGFCRSIYAPVAFGNIVISSVSSIGRATTTSSSCDTEMSQDDEEEEAASQSTDFGGRPLRMVKREWVEGYNDMSCQFEGSGQIQQGDVVGDEYEESDANYDGDQNYPDSGQTFAAIPLSSYPAVGQAFAVARVGPVFSKGSTPVVKKELD